jgi:hypothetical protein
MTTLSTVLRYEVFFLLAALAVIVFYRLLTGQINASGLLSDKAPKSEVPKDKKADVPNGKEADAPKGKKADNYDGVISPGRIQMLVATLLLTIYIVTKVAKTNQFPDIPNEYLWALGGSHGLYLAGKVYGMLAEKLENSASRMVERSKPKIQTSERRMSK